MVIEYWISGIRKMFYFIYLPHYQHLQIQIIIKYKNINFINVLPHQNSVFIFLKFIFYI